MSDPVIMPRARQLDWRRHDWEHLSLLHFLPNPNTEFTVDLERDRESPMRRFFHEAVIGWTTWMISLQNEKFDGCLPRLREWLLNPPAADVGKHVGLYLRYLLEDFFQELFAIVDVPNSHTKYGVVFSAHTDKALELLEALEDDFLTNRLHKDPFPHFTFMALLQDDPIKGCPPVDLFRPSTPAPGPLPVANPTVAPPKPSPPKGMCLYHVARSLGCTTPTGSQYFCQFGADCKLLHSDPFAGSADAFLSTAKAQLRAGPMREDVLAAAEARREEFA
jgi:hypothetical protein